MAATDKEKLNKIVRKSVHYDRREYYAHLTPADVVFLKGFAKTRDLYGDSERLRDNGKSGLRPTYFTPKAGSDLEKMLLDRQKRK